MAKERCRNCDNFSIFENRGNGKCSKCHGSGKDNSWASGIVKSIAGQAEKCYLCRGTGTCQKCGGKGYK